ncbi:4916_t:CDS:2, partial [Acaulospora colombiana]
MDRALTHLLRVMHILIRIPAICSTILKELPIQVSWYLIQAGMLLINPLLLNSNSSIMSKATNGDYGTPVAHPTQLAPSFNQTQGVPAPRGGRSRPLPAVPGGAPNRPQVQVPVPPSSQYGSDYKAPLPGMSQSSHGDDQYSTPAPPSHIPLKQPPVDAEYPRTHLTQDSYSSQPRHRTQDSGFTDSNSSHLSSYHQFDSPYSVGGNYDNQHNPYPNGPPSHQHADPSAYHQNNPTKLALSHPDIMNDFTQSMDDHRGGTMSTNLTGSSSYSGEALLSGLGGDPKIEQYRPHGQGSFLPAESPSSAHQIHSSPINAQTSEDVGTELGSHLLRSTSTASSFNSLLQEPRRSPTFEDGLLTPTLSRADLSLEASVPPSQTSHSYASKSYLFDRDTYSSNLSYGTPAIITTSADVAPSSSRRRHQQEYQRMASMKDRIPRGTHVKGSIPYPRAFTGKDIVSTIQTLIQKEFQTNMGFVITDRRAALQVARSLQGQLFFYEVEWGGRLLQDGLEDVYMFLDDNPASESSNAEYRHDRVEREELPTGATMLEGMFTGHTAVPEPVPDCGIDSMGRDGRQANTQLFAGSRDSSANEQQYVQDLDLIETIFIKELRRATPPIIAPENLEDFISEVFGNFFELRQCNRRILDVMLVRQREQGPIIQRIGDIFLGAAAEFRSVYPLYVGNLPVAEKRIKEEAETNPTFRRFLEQSSRQDTRGLDMKHFIYRPSEHLQKYPVLLEAIFKETAEGNPDADFLVEAEQAI